MRINPHSFCAVVLAGLLCTVFACGDDKKSNEQERSKGTEASGAKDTTPAPAPTESKAGPVDRAALEKVATTAVKAVVAKDPAALLTVIPASEHKEAGPAMAPGGRAHDAFFGETEWRYQACKNWDGSFSAIRVEKDEYDTRARLAIGEINGETVSVELMQQDGAWYFKDIRRGALAAWGKALE